MTDADRHDAKLLIDRLKTALDKFDEPEHEDFANGLTLLECALWLDKKHQHRVKYTNRRFRHAVAALVAVTFAVASFAQTNYVPICLQNNGGKNAWAWYTPHAYTNLTLQRTTGGGIWVAVASGSWRIGETNLFGDCVTAGAAWRVQETP